MTSVCLFRQTESQPNEINQGIFDQALSSLLLDSTAWGVNDPASLRFIDPPPAVAVAEARALLPVRESAMVLAAAKSGHGETEARVAVLMGERGLGGPSIDLDTRLRTFAGDKSGRAAKAHDLADRTARSLGARRGGPGTGVGAGVLMLRGFADRVARNRGPAADGIFGWPTAETPLSRNKTAWRPSRSSWCPTSPANRSRNASWPLLASISTTSNGNWRIGLPITTRHSSTRRLAR